MLLQVFNHQSVFFSPQTASTIFNSCKHASEVNDMYLCHSHKAQRKFAPISVGTHRKSNGFHVTHLIHCQYKNIDWCSFNMVSFYTDTDTLYCIYCHRDFLHPGTNI